MQRPDPLVAISMCCREIIMAETARWVANEVSAHRNYQFQLTNTAFPIDHQRNLQIECFLKSGYEWMFILDSDEVPPADAIEKMLDWTYAVDHTKPITVAIPSYRHVGEGQKQLMIYDYRERFVPHSIISNAVEWVDGVGVSGLMMPRQVVQELLPVRQEYDAHGHLVLDDSLAISKQLMDLGIKIPVLIGLAQTHLKLIPLI